MLKAKNKLNVLFLSLAVANLLFFSVGGEFLHRHIHHHKDKADHDNCSVSQLQAEVCIILGAIFIALTAKIGLPAALTYRVFVIRPRKITHFSHAPPIPC